MNGNFRQPKFVKRYEYNYYDLETPLNSIVANNARQIKNNYRFEVDNSSEANPIDWYNAYLEVGFKLGELADSDTGITVDPATPANKCTTTNGQTFNKEIEVECGGESVYNNTRGNTQKVMQILLEQINFSLLIQKQELRNQTQHLQPRPPITKVLQKDKF